MVQEYIEKRKSIRKYKQQELTNEQLKAVKKALTLAKPLFPEIKYEIIITDKVNYPFGFKAPAYLLFYSEERDNFRENIGYLGAWLSLYLLSLDLGSCWVGMAKPLEQESDLTFVIAMAIGEANEELFRKPEDYKRKELSKICNSEDEMFKVIAKAPSAINAQDWYFYQEQDLVHCYFQPAKLPLRKLVGKMINIDLGIAICYLTLVHPKYEIIKLIDYPEVKNCQYFITVHLL